VGCSDAYPPSSLLHGLLAVAGACFGRASYVRYLAELPSAARGLVGKKVAKIALTYSCCECAGRIGLEHARAATTVVKLSSEVEHFVRQYASVEKTHNRIESKIIDALESSRDGLSQTEIRRYVLHGHVLREDLKAVLNRLGRQGRIRFDSRPTPGRSEIIWKLARYGEEA